jgi:hypothetical protein
VATAVSHNARSIAQVALGLYISIYLSILTI